MPKTPDLTEEDMKGLLAFFTAARITAPHCITWLLGFGDARNVPASLDLTEEALWGAAAVRAFECVLEDRSDEDPDRELELRTQFAEWVLMQPQPEDANA